MSHLCHICHLPFTRGYNLRRHIERVHKQSHGDVKMNGGNYKKGIAKRSHDSSDGGSYDDISESDTINSASDPLEEDTMTDSSETYRAVSILILTEPTAAKLTTLMPKLAPRELTVAKRSPEKTAM
ncbi:hypothetical protein HOLleu_40910 [Holothuria leucospilota]|uniref:C2H2-type domain-containing protein n=1 Tax=Holothuria leucospilota TaxID=206669 RepID=A0A9Q0YEV8_HOLLE|nr:hypothetical protein HOLleu_40910 [Holothuria leucospilota]